MHALNSCTPPEEEEEPLLTTPCLISMRTTAWELGRAAPGAAPAGQFYDKVRRNLGAPPAVSSAMESIFAASLFLLYHLAVPSSLTPSRIFTHP